MILHIPALLDSATLTAFRDLATRDDLFQSGVSTAGWHARSRKHNLQGQDHPLVRGLLKKAEQALLAHPLLQAAARPKDFVNMLLSRYDVGMAYGNHVDDAIMRGKRTDISFTLFLSSPKDYDGGALVIDEPAGERHFKPEAGSLLLYPSTSLHRVEPVTRGQRVVVVGWIQSLIRDPQQREVLFDLERSIELLRHQGGDQDALNLILKTRSNLVRLWAEP